jgi:cytochrome c-type biogenesis protein CcmH/NrfG
VKDLLFFVGVVLFVILLVVGVLAALIWGAGQLPEGTFIGQYEARLTEVAHCQALEQFTTDQCVIMVGGD